MSRHSFIALIRPFIVVLVASVLFSSLSGCANLAASSSQPIVTVTPVRPTVTPLEIPTSAPTSTPADTPTPADTLTPAPTAVPPTPTLAVTVAPPHGKNELGVSVVITPGLVISNTPVPPPAPLVAMPSDTINVLLLGSDSRPGETIGRTDTIIIASINPQVNYVTMLSIPRDLYVYIPGIDKFDRINTVAVQGAVHRLGGPADLLAETIRYNLGIPINYYAIVNFAGVRSIIDKVGGVDVLAHCPLYDVFPDLPPDQSDIITDTARLTSVPTGTIDIPAPGLYALDGKHALWFARSRYSTSDFDRSRRQQAVLRALWTKIKAQGLINQLPNLWGDVTKLVGTNLSLNDVIYLASFGSQLDDSRIKMRSIDGQALQNFTTEAGSQVLLIVPERVQLVIDEAFTPPLSNVTSQAAAQVDVQNGSGNKNWDLLAVDRLTSQGFVVPSYGPADKFYPKTQLINFNTTSKGSRLNQLVSLFNLKPDQVINQPTENSPIAFRLIVGSDFNSCKSPGSPVAFPTPTPTPAPTPTRIR